MTRPTVADIPRLRGEEPMATRYLTYAQAAAYLSMPVGTLRLLVSHRKIPHARMGPRLVRFELADLDGWIAAGEVEADRLAAADLRGNRAASEAHEHAILRIAPNAARKGFKRALADIGGMLVRESYVVPDAFVFDDTTKRVTIYEIEHDHPISERKFVRLRALSDALGTVGWSIRLLAAASSESATEIDIETGALTTDEITAPVDLDRVRFEMPE